MAVKTITITEDAYERVKSLKREGESFSELFLRLSNEKRSTGRSIVGLLKGEDTERLLKTSKEIRRELEKEARKREHVFAGQFGSNRAGDRRKEK